MRKRLFCMILTVTVCMSLFGCGKDKKDEEPGSDVTEEVNEPAENQDDTSVDQQEFEAEAEDALEDELESDDAEAAYMSFLSEESLAKVITDRDPNLREGNKYSFSDIVKAYISGMYEFGYDANVNLYDASYTYIDCGDDGSKEMAVWLNIGRDGAGDYDNALYLFAYKDGEVCLFGSDDWGYRSELTLNEKGYVINGGAGGASLYLWDHYFYNADLERVFLYRMEEEMGLAKPTVNRFYLKNGFDRTDYQPEYDAKGKGYYVYTYSFKEIDYNEELSDDENYMKYYRDFKYCFTDYRDQPAEPDAELAAFYKDENIKWYSPDEMDTMVLDHQHMLGADDDIINADKVTWDNLVDKGLIKYKVVREDGPQADEKEVVYYTVLDDREKPFISQNAQNTHEFNPVDLEQVSCNGNNITDVDDWFMRAGSSRPGTNISDTTYRYELTGDKGYGTMTQINIYDKVSGDWLYNIDLSDFLYEKGYENKDFVDRGVHNCFSVDNYLYLNMYHTTYAEDCSDNAYIICLDLNTGDVVWISDALVANSGNFVRYGDCIITGYGFTDEDDYIYILNRYTGERVHKIKTKKSPDYFCFVDGDLWVRTYSYDYVYKIK